MTTSLLPRHIAIIMDGNGRWAKKRFLPRVAGHRAGVAAVHKIVKYCATKQIEVLSLFAFSSENWQRPQDEVHHLMELFLSNLENEASTLNENNLRLRFIGDRTKFHDKLREKINAAEQLMSQNTGMVLVIAADYGGQWDILQATRRLANEVASGLLKSEDISEACFKNKLSFSDLPDPDLFIRTSGEVRISNFMLWQLAYSELY